MQADGCMFLNESSQHLRNNMESADTVRRTIRRDEAEGLDGLQDRRHDHLGSGAFAYGGARPA